MTTVRYTIAETTLFFIFCAFSWKSARRLQGDIKHTAGLARANHVDVKFRENLGMLGERFAEGAAAFDGFGSLTRVLLSVDVSLPCAGRPSHAATANQRQ